MSPTEASVKRRELAGWLQLVLLIVAVGALFLTLGRKDQQLTNLVENTRLMQGLQLDNTVAIADLRARINGLEARPGGD